MKKFYMHVIICCLIFAYSTFSIEDMLMTENIFSVVNIINKNVKASNVCYYCKNTRSKRCKTIS